jgi:hypothetical protein
MGWQSDSGEGFVFKPQCCKTNKQTKNYNSDKTVIPRRKHRLIERRKQGKNLYLNLLLGIITQDQRNCTKGFFLFDEIRV